MSSVPRPAAACSAVLRVLSVAALISTPFSRQSFMASMGCSPPRMGFSWPMPAATMKAVTPALVTAFGSAPFSSKKLHQGNVGGFRGAQERRRALAHHHVRKVEHRARPESVW